MEKELWKKKRREKGGKLWNKVKRGFLSVSSKERKEKDGRDERVEHVFVVPCYGKSPYLETMLRSLLAQKKKSPIYLCTSTDSSFLQVLAKKYHLPLFIRKKEPSLARDWNFALEIGRKRGKLVTIAHQDDCYHEDYSLAVCHAFRSFPDGSLIFTQAEDINSEGEKIPNISEKIKRLLRLPYCFTKKTNRLPYKLLPLSFGNSIPCPSCTYVMEKTPEFLFDNKSKFVTDWRAFLRLAKGEGRFLYVKKPLLYYRRHPSSETRKQMKDNRRRKEEREVLQSIHGKLLGGILSFVYSASSFFA